MRVKVEVTACDIKKGCKYAASNCPVARAINRKLKWIYKASVCNSSFCIGTDSTTVADKAMPKAAGEFVRAFDNGHLVKPFSFTVSLPAKLVR